MGIPKSQPGFIKKINRKGVFDVCRCPVWFSGSQEYICRSLLHSGKLPTIIFQLWKVESSLV